MISSRHFTRHSLFFSLKNNSLIVFTNAAQCSDAWTTQSLTVPPPQKKKQTQIKNIKEKPTNNKLREIKRFWPLLVPNQDLRKPELCFPFHDLQNNWIVLFTSKSSLVPCDQRDFRVNKQIIWGNKLWSSSTTSNCTTCKEEYNRNGDMLKKIRLCWTSRTQTKSPLSQFYIISFWSPPWHSKAVHLLPISFSGETGKKSLPLLFTWTFADQLI